MTKPNLNNVIVAWWVHSEHRESGNKSRVGPFETARKAADFVNDYRPADFWRRVMITSRVQVVS